MASSAAVGGLTSGRGLGFLTRWSASDASGGGGTSTDEDPEAAAPDPTTAAEGLSAAEAGDDSCSVAIGLIGLNAHTHGFIP